MLAFCRVGVLHPHLHTIVGNGGDLGPDVVHKMLGQPPVFVKGCHEWGQQQHDHKQRQGQEEGGCVKYEALH